MQPLGCMRASKDERRDRAHCTLRHSGARHPSRLVREDSARLLLRMTALANRATLGQAGGNLVHGELRCELEIIMRDPLSGSVVTVAIAAAAVSAVISVSRASA